MHSRWRYKICTCCFILGELKSFRNYKGFSIILPLIPLSIKGFNPNILRFPFLYEVTIFASPNRNFTENSRRVGLSM